MLTELSIRAMPWQQLVYDLAGEMDSAGRLVYDEVNVLLPRQQGKTTLVLGKIMHRVRRTSVDLGPQRCTYTAQTRIAARKKLEREFASALRGVSGLRELTNAKDRPSSPNQWMMRLNNGSEHIQIGDSVLQIDAPSRTAGHGDTLDDGTIDEAFAHKDDEVEQALRPAQATRRDSQLWVTSTAGDEESFYLWSKVLAGRAACESGEHGRVAYVEFSAPDDADPGDPATWWGCMPALGITITEEFIAGEWDRARRRGQDGIDAFCRSYLNRWPKVPVLRSAMPSAIDFSTWLDLAAPDVERGTDVMFGVAASPDQEWAAIAVAWLLPDGSVFVQLADYRPGTWWVDERVRQLRASWSGRVVLSTSARGLVPGEVEPSAQLQAQAHNRLASAVATRSLSHGNQGGLNVAVRESRWRQSGDVRIFDRRGDKDISPVDAAALAVHGALTEQRTPAPPPLLASGLGYVPSATADLSTLAF